MGHALAFFFGLTSPNQWPYLMWSGVGSDASKVALLGGLVHFGRQHLIHTHKASARLKAILKHHGIEDPYPNDEKRG